MKSNEVISAANGFTALSFEVNLINNIYIQLPAPSLSHRPQYSQLNRCLNLYETPSFGIPRIIFAVMAKFYTYVSDESKPESNGHYEKYEHRSNLKRLKTRMENHRCNY